MSTFLLIIKILPWVLSLCGGAYGFFTHKRTKFFKDKYDQHLKTIEQLKGIVIDQGEQIQKQSEQISELMEINKKYEKKKKSIKNSKSATDSMASKR